MCIGGCGPFIEFPIESISLTRTSGHPTGVCSPSKYGIADHPKTSNSVELQQMWLTIHCQKCYIASASINFLKEKKKLVSIRIRTCCRTALIPTAEAFTTKRSSWLGWMWDNLIVFNSIAFTFLNADTCSNNVILLFFYIA